MSRVGKQPVTVPAGVKVTHTAGSRTIKVEGPKGTLEFTYRPEVSVEWNEDDKQLVCSIPENRIGEKQLRAYWGTTRARLQNLVKGVHEGFEKKLEIQGVGWNIKPKGKGLELNVGYCHPIDLPFPAGVEAEVQGPQVIIRGADKQAVGQYAAVVRSKRPPEPYKGKGIRYVGEYVIRKQGKAFGS